MKNETLKKFYDFIGLAHHISISGSLISMKINARKANEALSKK